MNNYLRGIADIFDFAGCLSPDELRSSRDDASGLASDWGIIGQEMSVLCWQVKPVFELQERRHSRNYNYNIEKTLENLLQRRIVIKTAVEALSHLTTARALLAICSFISWLFGTYAWLTADRWELPIAFLVAAHVFYLLERYAILNSVHKHLQTIYAEDELKDALKYIAETPSKNATDDAMLQRATIE